MSGGGKGPTLADPNHHEGGEVPPAGEGSRDPAGRGEIQVRNKYWNQEIHKSCHPVFVVPFWRFLWNSCPAMCPSVLFLSQICSCLVLCNWRTFAKILVLPLLHPCH